jgi:hypothetical protein
MNSDERIEAALKRQPADERVYDEPLAALVNGEGVQRVRPTTRSRVRTGALPALAAVLAVAIGVGALAVVGLPAVGGPSGAPRTGSAPVPVASLPLIGCWGQGPGFSPDLLTGPGSAETGDSAAAAVLRQFVSSPNGSDAPAHGWYLMEATSDEVQFVARVPSGGPPDFWQVVVNRGTAGQFVSDGWSLGGYGSCVLETVPPAGYGPATWTLDPSVPFAAGANELHILVAEQSCHGSDPTEVGRILANVAYTDRDVVVTVVARSPEGAQTCPAPPPTPYVVVLDQPVGNRDLQDGGSWPPPSIATGGHVVVVPTPTPEPSNWHMPMDCTGEADGPGSFKAASMSATFDVYCAALPAGWHRESMSGDEQVVTTVTVSYSGPNGEILTLSEGDLCSGGLSVCAPTGTSAGTAMFGDREGQLFTVPPGADFALYVDPGKSPSWEATGKGMSLETFKTLTSALIIVGK